MYLDNYLRNNPWKIHEEFGLLIDDIHKDFTNPQRPRPHPNWLGHHSVNNPANPALAIQNISIANGVFVQNGYSVRPEYSEAVLGVYQSILQNLDFLNNAKDATKFINE